MADDFDVIRKDVSFFLSSLRRSIDRPFRTRPIVSSVERDSLLRRLLAIEESRIRFDTFTRYQEQPTFEEWASLKDNLLGFIDRFVHSDNVNPDMFERRFISSPLMSRDRSNLSKFVQYLSERENNVRVADALMLFKSYVEKSDIQRQPEQTSLSFEELRNIVPRQQVAPAQFEIIDGKITVANRLPRVVEADKDNIRSALEHVKNSGEQLIKNLENSNCDKRLLESVKDLQAQLDENTNIVKVGLTNMACGVMSSQFHDELPNAIVAMFNSHNANVSLYVAQFPEWEQFTQKAALIALDDNDILDIDAAAADVIASLTENPAIADPEVPRTIALVRQFLSFPGPSSKRAAFALIRTLENLVSSILRYSLAFMDKTADAVVDAGAKAAAKVIVGLLGVALVSASSIGPAAVHAGAPWVKQAVDIVQKQIDKMAK